MLKCNGKTFMNLQEAVQWLLNNNALFFMCEENYVADTEISLEELVNPSPANPKIGSLVLFADGNIAAITGITDDSFIVGSDTINIRLDKTVTNFELSNNHIIVHYSDGTSDDLGDIFSGDVAIGGILTANEAKIFEDITDKDGHNRFIEGEIEARTITGFTFSYGKWSLSGSHLLVVLTGSVANGTSFSYGTIATLKDVPQWVKDKLVVIYGTSGVDVKTLPVYASNYSTQNITAYLTKSGTTVSIDLGSNTFSADRVFRISFDLLIDNE